MDGCWLFTAPWTRERVAALQVRWWAHPSSPCPASWYQWLQPAGLGEWSELSSHCGRAFPRCLASESFAREDPNAERRNRRGAGKHLHISPSLAT